MLTLTYGYKKPQTGDKGFLFWPALEFDIQRLNDHSHNGIDSTKITSSSIEAVNQSTLAAAWSSTGNGNYTQTVTVPLGLNLTKTIPMIYDVASGSLLSLSLVKISNTQFTLTTNTNTLDLLIAYV